MPNLRKVRRPSLFAVLIVVGGVFFFLETLVLFCTILYLQRPVLIVYHGVYKH